MEFFGMGPLEIIVILVVALIAFGPGRLPQLARNLGKGVRAFRKATMDLTTEVTREFDELDKAEKEPPQSDERKKDSTEKAARDEATESTR